MRNIFAYVVGALWVAGCACATPMYSKSDALPPDPAITLVTLSSESEALEAVEVTALLTNGHERVLGRTDAFGILRVRPEDLGNDVKVILFCREGFFCGALRTSDPSFHEYGEHLIALAPFMVR